jgi:hypothetical protein
MLLCNNFFQTKTVSEFSHQEDELQNMIPIKRSLSPTATMEATELDWERLRLSWSLSVLSPCSSSASWSSLRGDLSPPPPQRSRGRAYSGE